MKRVLRSAHDRKIAGVCGGLGEYFELDPILFRSLFLVFAFMGGSGLLAYLVLWIMVPSKGDAPGVASGHRLRLSQKDRKIGGVCGGLGEYLDLDPVFFRALIVVLAFFGGFGILLYVVLWLVMPQAQTESQAAGHGPGSGEVSSAR